MHVALDGYNKGFKYRIKDGRNRISAKGVPLVPIGTHISLASLKLVRLVFTYPRDKFKHVFVKQKFGRTNVSRTHSIPNQ